MSSSSLTHSPTATFTQLQGMSLWFTAFALAIANFVVVLDMTIANVSIPHIAGGIGISPREGTYVITSYAVAEAISVPLTGWIANRFGTVRIFSLGVISFGVFSILCGLAPNFLFLIVGRIFQGLTGGPLMPLSQTLLMKIFPAEKRMLGMAIWGMTTMIAPICGPIFGGIICDTWGWNWIFLINIPFALLCGILVWRALRLIDQPTRHSRVDFIGLILMILFVSSLQLILDEGHQMDWFQSKFIVLLSVIAFFGFIAFLLWELTQCDPIIDLSVFSFQGYTMTVLVISTTFGAFFASIVLLPLWLQTNMGYTASDAGYIMACHGLFGLLCTPIATHLAQKFDLRKIAGVAIIWIGIMTIARSFNTRDMDFWSIAIPLMLQGVAMPFFFIPLSNLALSSLQPEKISSGAGLMNFLRTLAGAFGTSVATTSWFNHARSTRHMMSGTLHVGDTLLPPALMEMLVDMESVMLSTNYLFFITGFAFFISASLLFFVPKSFANRVAHGKSAIH